MSDLDGVIRFYPVQRNLAIELKYNLVEGILLKTAFEKSLLTKVVNGFISDDEWRIEILNELLKRFPTESTRHAVGEWSDFSGEVDHNYLINIESCFPNLPVALLTNGTTRLNSDLKKLGIENRFYKIFNSSEIGFSKPDLKVYDYIIGDLGCKADEILFIDDSLSHIEAAAQAGLKTHHYVGLENFRNFFLNSEKKQVVAAIIRRDNKFLLGKRSQAKKSGAGYWSPICGRIEPNESETEAVEREVFEEVGLKVKARKKVTAFDTRDKSALIHWWVVDIIEGDPEIKNDEHSEIRWVTTDEMSKLDNVFIEDIELFKKIEASMI